ncbi:MAG: hypothetical protein JXR95_04575 [Deltaproteobacteria bacterium]|nr:hypothetical protein [Deltaproteobacteria bacterium]
MIGAVYTFGCDDSTEELNTCGNGIVDVGEESDNGGYPRGELFLYSPSTSFPLYTLTILGHGVFVEIA